MANFHFAIQHFAREISMIIHDMSRQEIADMLSEINIGYLACSVDNKPYVVPLRFVHSGGYLYSLTSEGKKMELMRGNPNVCVNFSDTHGANKWRSLVIAGVYEEIKQSASKETVYYHAYELLSSGPEWWEPAYVKTIIRGEERSLEPVYFRISIMETTGHKTQP